MDDVSHVGVLGLRRRAVRRHVEVARDLKLAKAGKTGFHIFIPQGIARLCDVTWEHLDPSSQRKALGYPPAPDQHHRTQVLQPRGLAPPHC